MKTVLMLILLLGVASCDNGSGARNQYGTVKQGLKSSTKDMPALETAVTLTLVNKAIGETALSSVFLTEYSKVESLPAIQFTATNDIVGELETEDVLRFVLVTETTTLTVSQDQVDAGVDNGIAILSPNIKVGDVWSVKKKTAVMEFWMVFKIINYTADKNLKIQYKLKSFKYL